MYNTLRRFFSFCDNENRKKFYYAIAIGLVNSFFIALKIVAVSIMFDAVITSATENAPFNPNAIWQSLLVMLISVIGATVKKSR